MKFSKGGFIPVRFRDLLFPGYREILKIWRK
nr:MAG TPA: hypothetical protein [Bacteriophage sp.]